MDQELSPESWPDRPVPPPDDDQLEHAPTDVVKASTYAELSAMVLERQPLGAVLHRIADLAVKTIPNVDDVSVTLIERGQPRTVAFSGELAVALDERQYAQGFGPCLDAARHGQTLLIDTHEEVDIYPEFARQARRAGIRHVLSIGMPALQQTSGGMNVYSSGAAGPMDETTLTTATTFAGHAAVTLFNAALYAGAQDEVSQMRQAMASRAQIEQAKGIIMSQRRCTADQAFSAMVEMSSRSNRKLRDVAASIIAEATAG